LVRQRELVAPVGFFAADPASQVIIGTRVSDVTELVVYGWRWHAATLARGRSPS
jgi:hypothetical protein